MNSKNKEAAYIAISILGLGLCSGLWSIKMHIVPKLIFVIIIFGIAAKLFFMIEKKSEE